MYHVDHHQPCRAVLSKFKVVRTCHILCNRSFCCKLRSDSGAGRAELGARCGSLGKVDVFGVGRKGLWGPAVVVVLLGVCCDWVSVVASAVASEVVSLTVSVSVSVSAVVSVWDVWSLSLSG